MNTAVNYKIDDETLKQINAGTFTANNYAREVYEHAGFKLNRHFFAKDEFIKGGKVYYHDEANAIVESMGYKVYKVYRADRIVCIVELNGREVLRYYESYDGPED